MMYSGNEHLMDMGQPKEGDRRKNGGRDSLSFADITALTRGGPDSCKRRVLEAKTNLCSKRFVIEEIIGSGGEGIVYKAYDRALEQCVALKILHFDEAWSVPLLKREFRFLRDLIHPSLVQLHELVVDREMSFFTMSLVEGENFLDAARDEDTLRHLLRRLAEVLTFLHKTGRIHRDIKATNILVDAKGALTLLDFGVALNLTDRQSTRRGPLGTPRYMAPELLEAAPATEKCDAYSVGVLLFEALTGRHPSPTGRTERTERSSESAPLPSETGKDVPRDLDLLCGRLLHPDPQKRAGIEAILELEPPSSGVASTRRPELAGPNREEWFTGRKHELGRLEETFERMKEGYQAIATLIEAQSGMGKTAFIDRFLETRDDALVLRSKCSEHELVPHKAIDGIIDDLVLYLMEKREDEVLEMIPPADASILVQLFPEFSRVAPLDKVSPIGTGPGDYRSFRQRAYRALAGVLGRVSDEEALIIAIDDLQWGDVDSGKLLREVFAGAAKPRCLLLLAFRSEEKDKSACLSAVTEGEHSITGQLVSSKISLEPLLRRDARNLVQSLAGTQTLSSETVQAIVDEADGSPLLLTELVSHLKGIPDADGLEMVGIDKIVNARVQRLPESHQRAFGVLCCNGGPLPVRLMPTLFKRDPEEILRSLQGQRLARIRRGGQEVEVFHDSIREAMLRRLGDSKAPLHAAIAAALVAKDGDAAEIARHYSASGQPISASHWAEIAAERANSSFALAQATGLYRLALEGSHLQEAKKRRLREALADALAASGRGTQAAPILARLAEDAEPVHALALRRRAAEQWLISGEPDRGRAMLERVQKDVGLSWPNSDNQALRRFLLERARLRFSLARVHAPNGRKCPPRLASQLEACRSAWPFAFISTVQGSANSARYLRLALKSGDRDHLAVGYGMEAIYRASTGSTDREVALDHLKRAKELTPDDAQDYRKAFLSYVEAQCSFLLGDTARSPALYEEAERIFLDRCRNVSWELNSARIFWSQSLSALGRNREWGWRLDQWLADAEDRGDGCLYGAMKIGQGRRSILVDGDLELAESLLKESHTRWDPPMGGVHYFMERLARGFIHSCSGRPESVLEMAKITRLEMKQTHMMRVQVPRVNLTLQEGFSLVECAVDSKDKSQRSALLKKAKIRATTLAKENVAWATALSRQLDASIRLCVAPTAEALGDLRAAGELFEKLDYRLNAAAIRARVGELIGGDEGNYLLDEAHTEFTKAECSDWVGVLSAYTPRILPR